MHPHCWDDSGGRRRPLFLSGLPPHWKERWMEERKRRRQETERGLGCEVDPWPTLTRTHPPQLGLLSEDRAFRDILHVKSRPLESPSSPLDPLECDKVRVQTLSGARGSQIELGSDTVDMFLCVNLCVCAPWYVDMCLLCLLYGVVTNLWSRNAIREQVWRKWLSQGFTLMQTNVGFMFFQHPLSPFFFFLPVHVCLCVGVYLVPDCCQDSLSFVLWFQHMKTAGLT